MLDALAYAYDELRTNYRDKYWWEKRIADRVVGPVHEHLYPTHAGSVRVMDEDWDVLCVLDGCRADLFECVADREPFDDYRRATSAGSATPEWTRRNFRGGSFGDTVYVSANPYTSRLAGNAFHEIVEVWRDGFDAEVGTVRPETVAAAARDADERHPDKRVIVHFMQPHYPVLGHPDLQFAGIDAGRMLGMDGSESGMDQPHDPWEALSLGLVSRQRVWRAYRDNLETVLDPALAVARDLTGRSVLTSDHGNLLGERAWPVPVRLYGHPAGVRVSALIEVPWAVLEGERRTVRDEGTTPVGTADEAAMNERLRALGYRE